MSELKDVASKQEVQKVQSVWKHRILGIVSVVLLLYLAYCCVYQRFVILTFLNGLSYMILKIANKVILFFSDLVRGIFNIF